MNHNYSEFQTTLVWTVVTLTMIVKGNVQLAMPSSH